MQLDSVSKEITFKCDNVFWEAVNRGVKTAEIRWLSRSEWCAVLDNPPTSMWLTDLKSGISIWREIGWFAAVGEVCGSTQVLFCFKPQAAV